MLISNEWVTNLAEAWSSFEAYAQNEKNETFQNEKSHFGDMPPRAVRLAKFYLPQFRLLNDSNETKSPENRIFIL